MPSKNNLSALKVDKPTAAAILDPKKNVVHDKPKTAISTVKRVNKGFQVEADRVKKWDTLVAQMKNKTGDERRTGPQLIDEALDYLFNRYLNK